MSTPIQIPDHARDLVDRPLLMTLATRLGDDSIQLTPIWFNFDEGCIFFNTEKGRLKDRIIRKRPRVSIIILDPDNRARWLAVRGTVIEITDDAGWAHINFLAKRYMGIEKFGGHPDEQRVRYKILPEHVTAAEMYAPTPSAD